MMITSTLNRLSFILVISIYIFSCAHSEKSANPIPVQAPSKLQRIGNLKELRLGVIVRIPGADRDTTKNFTESFQDQLGLFEGCHEASNRDTWDVEVSWTSAINGLLTSVNIDRINPNAADLKDCVLTKLADIDVGHQTAVLKGRLILGSYHGQIPPWRFSGPIAYE